MKQYNQMTAEERVQYNTSFAAWYANRDQITLCIQQTGGMDQVARAAFDAGTQFVMAWPFGPGFQESVACLPAARCAPRLMQLTDIIRKKIGTVATAPHQPVIDPRQPHVVQPKPIETPRARTIESSNNRNLDASNNQNIESSPTSPLPIANLHIDQLTYLLSPKVAERARSLKAKLDERDISSNRAKDLAIAGATNDEIAPYAKAASDAQEFVSKTYEMIDDELAEYVATELYIKTHRAADEAEDTMFRGIIANITELAKPFGSIDRFCAALTPYYRKANTDGRIDRQVAQRFEKAAASQSSVAVLASSGSTASQSSATEPAAAPQSPEYKRIWTYLNRKDVAHTDKRLRKMRQEIDKAIADKMPNIEAMEAIYAHEAELVLAEQQKRLNDEEPSLL